MRRHLPLLAVLAFLDAVAVQAQTALLDRVDRALAVSTADGRFGAELSGLTDLETYYIDQRPPGLIFGGDSSFFTPRLSLFLDAHAGQQLYAFVEARFDRGFDPRASGASARLDQYLLRWTPHGSPMLHLQVGKFATVVGTWAARHESWTNPLINAPFPYENMTTISDGAAPAGPAAFLARRDIPDRKYDWVPIVWGPSYASGAAVFGHVAALDYAFEAKNAALSSRPPEWDGPQRVWDHPTGSGRLGIRPSPAWTLGTSFSWGPYLRERAAATLPPGRTTGDYPQMVAGADAGFARRHLQLWAEFYASSFAVPNVGDVGTAAWYLEGRYQLTPRLFAALRWNQQVFDKIDDGHGQEVRWDRNAWRVDTGLGFRFDRHLQAKLQYAFRRQQGPLQQGEQLVAMQITLRF